MSMLDYCIILHMLFLFPLGMYRNDSDYKNCKSVVWNPVGSSMMYQDFGIPVFVLQNETEVNSAIHDVSKALQHWKRVGLILCFLFIFLFSL